MTSNGYRTRQIILAGLLCFFLLLRSAFALVCDDRARCTIEDTCHDGQCSGLAIQCPDDGNACTRNICSPATGTCISEPITCSGPCFTGECDPATGCVALLDGSPCDDGSTCTEKDICFMGFCHGAPVENGTPCSDRFGPCTIDDQCLRGTCVGVLRQCPDSDHDLCTPEFCDFLNGACITLPRLECDRPCEVGPCDRMTGTCAVIEDGTPCSDDNVCTSGDVCRSGECSGTAAEMVQTATPTITSGSSPTHPAPPSVTKALPTRTSPVPIGPSATPTRPPTAVPTFSVLSPTSTGVVEQSSHGCALHPAPKSGSNLALGLFRIIPVWLFFWYRRRPGRRRKR